jgi:hypothetical protein
MKHLLTGSMIGIGLLAAAPLAPAYAASSRHPITHTRVVNGHPASRVPALGSPSRGGYEANGYAPSGGYRYADGARSSYEEQLIQTTQHTY